MKRMTRRYLFLPLLFAASSSCAAVSPFFNALFSRGISGSASSSPTVHCQVGPDGNPQCYEYRTGAPLRAGDPAAVGADPNASIGENANASAVAVSSGTPANALPDPSWKAPLALPPEPVRVSSPP